MCTLFFSGVQIGAVGVTMKYSTISKRAEFQRPPPTPKTNKKIKIFHHFIYKRFTLRYIHIKGMEHFSFAFVVETQLFMLQSYLSVKL